MSNESFRLESFRPWNPHEKPRSQQGPLDLRRYPSPVSLNATPSPKNSKDSMLHSQIPHAPEPERHPLPVRPPMEVCVDGAPQSVVQNIRQPDLEGQMSPANQDSDNLDLKEIMHLQNLPSSGHIDDLIFNSVDEHFEQRTHIGSSDLEPSFTPDQVSQSMAFQISTPPGMENFASDLTIDPAMLEEDYCRVGEQQDTTEIAPPCTSRQAGLPVDNCPSTKDDSSPYGRRCHSPTASDPSRRSSKIQKVSVVIDNRQQKNQEKSNRRPGHQKASLSTIIAQFSALPVEDRLQFLSWLFEGALSRCLPRPGEVNTKSRTMPSDDVSSTRTQNASPGSCSSRKRLRYSAEENRLLIQLKEVEGLPWREVIRRFDDNFPGRRSPQSIQVHWSAKLSKKRSSRV
ncbi:hypothetical protein N7481_008448 [Penicillium waksmanii]|uniref:uncharacterized protein n=1 Tax=Penicillium waksmanii TaxID=69791 RepID=UPI00254901F5|nr:uncharacterized protein N7481_008448 [Penicillium waksmanii]KAJ5974741.1 hypothetical protein N7481_008448 [Penicillium waksmanii]